MNVRKGTWDISFVSGLWRATFTFTTASMTQGILYGEFETEQEALMYVLGSSL